MGKYDNPLSQLRQYWTESETGILVFDNISITTQLGIYKNI